MGEWKHEVGQKLWQRTLLCPSVPVSQPEDVSGYSYIGEHMSSQPYLRPDTVGLARPGGGARWAMIFGSVSYKVLPGGGGGHALHRRLQSPSCQARDPMIAECCGFLADVLGVALCLQWSCSSLQRLCSIASADCSCRVSGPPAQPGFYEVRITQHKNIIHIGRRARQCGCGGWRAASCGWPGPGPGAGESWAENL